MPSCRSNRRSCVDDTTVRLQQTDPPPGQNMLPLGTSLRAGDVVLRAGAILRPIEIAILAEIGRAVVNVRPRPRVAVLPTGNELVPVGEKPAPARFATAMARCCWPPQHARVPRRSSWALRRDDRERLTHSIEQGLAADVLVLSGGVSAGKFDLVPDVLSELGVEQVFHKIALRPGKPLWFGVKDDGERHVLVFGLPGNPVSSLVCFELFVRPAIAALAGRGFVGAPTIQARLAHDFNHSGGRAACLPARIVPTSAAPQVDERPDCDTLSLAGEPRRDASKSCRGKARPISPPWLKRTDWHACRTSKYSSPPARRSMCF